MNTIDIIHRIELVEEKIANIKHSGHFTEKEIDDSLPALELELQAWNNQLKLYGMTLEQYKAGLKIHNYYFSQMPSPALLNIWTTLGMNKISRG